MPVYLFKCDHCRKEHEVRLRMDEVGKKRVNCSGCGRQMERVYSFTTKTGKSSFCSEASCPSGTCPFVKK